MSTEVTEEVIEDESITLDELRKIAKYSTIDIIKALKIPRERLRDWIVRDFIRPSLPTFRQGVKAGFTKGDVYGIAIFEQLLEYGYKREAASEIIKNFMGINPISGALRFLVFKHTVRNGERQIETIGLVGGDITSLTDAVSGELMKAENNADEQWDSFHIMNIKEVIGKVNNALKELE